MDQVIEIVAEDPPDQPEMPPTFTERPLKAPKPKRAVLRRSQLRIFGFSTCFAFLLFISYFLLLIVQCILVGFWSNLYHLLNESMPKTFAWEVLVRMFGSNFNDCIDHNGPIPIRLTPEENCSYDFTMPPIPIIAMFLLSSFTLTSIFYGIEKLFFNLSRLLLRFVYLFGVLKMIFFVGAAISICISYANAGNNIRVFMKDEMEIRHKEFPNFPHITPRWEITQFTHQCCGIANFTDWKFEMFPVNRRPLYPRSCCDKYKYNCKPYPNWAIVFTQGCFEPEYAKIQGFSFTAVYLLSLDFLSTSLLIIIMSIVQTIHPGRETFRIRCQKKQKKESPTENTSRVPKNHSESLSNIATVVNSEEVELKDADIPDMNKEVDNQGGGDNAHSNNYPSLPRHNASTNNNLLQLLKTKPSSFPPEEEENKKYKYNELIVQRASDITFHIDSWGLHYKIKSESITKTHVLKKETIV